MKKFSKRLLSLLLALMMMFSLATFALAANAITLAATDTKAAVIDNAVHTINAYYSESGCYVEITATKDAGYTDTYLNWVLPDMNNAYFLVQNRQERILETQFTGNTATAKMYLKAATAAPVQLQLGNLNLLGGTADTTYALTVTADTVKAVAVNPSADADLGCGQTMKLTAAVTYANNKSVTGGTANWSSTGPVSVDTAGNVAASTTAVGAATVKATAGGIDSNTVNITVKPSASITPASPVEVDEGTSGTSVTAAVQPSGGTYTYKWTSDNAAVGFETDTANPAKVKVVTDISSVQKAKITCTVYSAGAEAAKSTADVNAYPKADSVAIYDGTNNVTGTTVPMTSTTKTLTCSQAPSAARGTVKWISGDPTVATVGETSGIVTATGKTGTASITCTFTNKDGTTQTASCTVSVSTQSKTASDVSMDATNHTDTSMSPVYNGIRNAYYNAYGSYPTQTAKITFNAVTNACGTVYKTSTGGYGSDNVAAIDGKTAYDFTALQSMVFSPNTVGTERITYTVSSTGTGTYSLNYLTGTILLNVKTSGSTIVVNLDGSDPYTFSYSTTRDGKSADTAIYSAILSATGKSYYYLTFDSSYSSAVGTLYANSSGTAVYPGAQYYYSGSGSTVSKLYFVPANSGVYSRNFSAYLSDGTLIFSGTLQLVVPSKAVSDVSYSTPISSTLLMNESDFTNWYKNQTNSSYYLSAVTFDSAKYSNTSYPGYFQHDGKTISIGNGAYYYTGTYNGTANSVGNYLSKVSYHSPIVTCYITVNFTCYGGPARNSEYIQKSGTMCICVTQNAVSDIRYTVTKNVGKTMAAGDFVDVYNNAMNVSTAGSFYVQFLNAPSAGTLTVGYVNASRPGVTLTSANVSSYSFYVNYTGSVYSISDVSYIPGNYQNNTDSVKYAAYGVNGQLLYIGEVDFIYGDGAAANACYSNGYTFAAEDFYRASDPDPVYYVTFNQPTTGTVYYNYAYGSGTAAASSVRFYTKYSNYGAYPVTSVVYIPRLGYSGSVSIPYTAVTATGKTTSGSFVLNVVSKTTSSTFYDVTPSNTGSWSANSVDYASYWGLVSGTDAYHFSPTAYMTRGMLVSVLYKAAGSPNTYGSMPFTDVKYTDYYYRPVLWAYNNGIVSGKTATQFAPNATVTREQFVTILYNYAARIGRDVSYGGSLYGYTDAGSISAYARNAMQWAVYRGYISGTTYNTLSPQGYANRAQTVVMLHRFLTQ